MIAIIDYGLGNIKAFVNVFRKLDIPVKVAKKNEDFISATKLILPGVGAFDHAMTKLINSGMREQLDEMVLYQKIPVIGICVGMQILAKSSDEGILPGLGWVDARVIKFDKDRINSDTRLPHMGWNDVDPTNGNLLFDGLDNKAKFYFLHSYYFACNQHLDEIAVSNYGYDFSCAINHNNIYGVQFHPEKSHMYGIKLLENFARL
jgi:imidazole glycerol-phosphate synthase subunit HisH